MNSSEVSEQLFFLKGSNQVWYQQNYLISCHTQTTFEADCVGNVNRPVYITPILITTIW